MLPVFASSTQFPPIAATPVKSVLAATSAPVVLAIDSIKACPSAPCATLQP